MKIVVGFLIAISIILVGGDANAQAFQKGNKNLDIGIGFGAYGTTQTVTTSFNGVPITSTESDGAASTIIPIRFEYGVGQKIGLGAELLFNNYFINDSDKVHINSVKSADFGLSFSFHLLNSDKNDLFISVGLGGSSLNIDYNTSQTQWLESVSGSGMYFSLGISDRIFFSDRIGILFNLGYRGYNYSDLDVEVSSEAQAVFALFGVTNYSQSWEWTFRGVHLGTGLAVKF